ncbi:hypothetical protein MCOR27_011775 [Pyricularia oryzae]|uniref:Survival Motor Neuron Gemin2-binding domain-containing protein n=2 Tax=Pyricularia TaxID=48558 RepID=A0ABQ8N3V8_PYRGI|nr:uncharacterized protein MGG_08592 [Pyricularia oryzae 70-15]KAH8844472.1 hypothetical protein MCOR01_005210 [Pyricularia oryzae]KAI6290827.1 hypothetical protein MCOR33_011016 [Pyricularia grisea]EHA49802.1 hypothetical protein MGG_08592 [Pyricularia oryzae 70-15]KAI6264201.1 hypothetical protein MCOR27_011775 [Pyricularia oryzae]KAI6282582.1 hypothetical protein MCOR26_002787 [Pyricularia oryzae]
MSEEEKVVTHEDIWDDSALVNSWNEALEEYKKYHSIHADRAAEATIVPDSQNPLRNAKTETNEPQSPPNGTRGDGETIQEQAKPTSGCPEGSGVNDQQHGGALSSPISVLGSVKDEGLKSLLMSWYYAGYYTGLYEGQQQRDPGKVNPDRR